MLRGNAQSICAVMDTIVNYLKIFKANIAFLVP